MGYSITTRKNKQMNAGRARKRSRRRRVDARVAERVRHRVGVRARARRASASSILARACDRASARRAPSSVETSSSASAALASSASRDASVDALAASRAGAGARVPARTHASNSVRFARQLALERRSNLIAAISRDRANLARVSSAWVAVGRRAVSANRRVDELKPRVAFVKSRSRRRRASFAVAAHRHGLERARVARGRRFQSRDHRARRVVAHRAANCRAG